MGFPIASLQVSKRRVISSHQTRKPSDTKSAAIKTMTHIRPHTNTSTNAEKKLEVKSNILMNMFCKINEETENSS
jgi:hypothetical protein